MLVSKQLTVPMDPKSYVEVSGYSQLFSYQDQDFVNCPFKC